jgi:hypothetical protein
MTSPNRLNGADTVKMADIIRAHCKLVDGRAVYDEDWSDQRVIEEMSGRANLNNVQNLRRQLVGDVRPKNGPDQLAELELRIEELERWAAARPVQPFRKVAL